MAPSNTILELDSNFLTHQLLSSPTKTSISNSCDSTNDSIPGMIMSASLQSCAESDNDNDSLSSSWRSSHSAQSPISKSPTSPRSIFKRYWSSPSSKNSFDKDDHEEALARLQTLNLPPPLVGEDDDIAACVIHHAPISSTVEQKASFDDASIDYTAPTQSPTRTRRQILPTPPPATAISSSLLMPRRQLMIAPRQWSSATNLGKGPNQSCLRKTRYTCSAIVASETTVVGREGKIHQGLRNSGCLNLNGGRQRPRAVSDVGDLKKSVSFYSQVSVFEFSPEIRRSQKGWSKYFA